LREALLMVAKAPVAGRVKTRLGPLFDADTAAEFYRCLILDTMELMLRVHGVDLSIAFTPLAARPYFEGIAKSDSFDLHPQRGPDLGSRLLNLFHDYLDRGYERVAILDSDSPTLPDTYLERSFALLEENDVVFGPCEDGGYYLVGAKAAHPGLFLDIAMSTATVLAETMDRARYLDLRTAVLPMWYDVDVAEDVHRLRSDLASDSHRAPDTARFFERLRHG